MDPSCFKIIAALVAIILFLLFKDYLCGTVLGQIMCPLLDIGIEILGQLKNIFSFLT